VKGGTNNAASGLGNASAININSGGTITVTDDGSGTDNIFLGYSSHSGLTITINAGGTLTSSSNFTTHTAHLYPGSLVLNGGTLAWGGAATSAWGSWNVDTDITVTDNSTISANFLTLTKSGGVNINVSTGKTLTLSGTIISTNEATSCSCNGNALKINTTAGIRVLW
jgi:hypothetical protein